MNSRRTKVQIYLDILRAVRRANGRLRKTHIVYKANLTHTRVQPYLDFLLSKGFLIEEKNSSQTFYVITEKGLDFLAEAGKLKEISDAFGLPLY
ncbi:Winged helix-turn-helix [uncultured archaeon]|nr:Winged helix-turn-helix [uncultured archaeon]